jgi:esterase/lipase superfamily enzyme
MECKIYGHAGRPVLFIPCQDGRFFDFENFHMTDVWAPWIDSGEVMVCSIDTIDSETYSDTFGDPRMRICKHEDWMRYITDEMVPFLQSLTRERNGEHAHTGILVFGCSLGATHAANLYFRRPDLFDGLLALSGIYSTEYGFGSYMDDLVYLNSPVHYLPNMPADHPYMELYQRGKAILCVGQGPWEVPETTFALRDILQQKGIPAWVDIWGYDCAHDWDWWYKQVTYFVPHLLD